MADYFTNFSLILKLPNEAAQTLALELAQQAQSMHGEEKLATFPAPLMEVVDDWQFQTEAQDVQNGFGLWLHSSNGGVDAVCAFIQYLLQKFDPDGCVSFQWSFDCSKPRIDAYGGGAAIITAKTIKSMGTGEWIQNHLARLHAHTNN